MKARYLGGGIGLASVVLLIALVGSASAKDQWFVLGEKAVKSMDPSAEIKAEEGKMSALGSMDLGGPPDQARTTRISTGAAEQGDQMKRRTLTLPRYLAFIPSPVLSDPR